MQVRQIHGSGRQRTFAVIMETSDEAMSQICRFAEREDITGALITGIGAFERAVLRYFDWDARQYRDIPVDEQAATSARMSRAVPRCTYIWSSAGATEARSPAT
jgi:hypothetical protein